MSNTTIVKQSRFWLPCSWGKTDFTAGQASALAMAISGYPAGIDAFSAPRSLSVVSVGIELDAVITSGFLRFQLAHDGTPSGPFADMDSGSGQRRLIELNPGTIVIDKGERVGVVWGSSPTLAPDGVIDGVILLEVEPV